MKILQVTAFFSPVLGGSAEAPYQLSRKLAEKGHQVTVYTSDYKLARDHLDSLPSVKVRPFRTWPSLATLYITPAIFGKAREEVRQFDVIHMHNFRTFQNVAVHHYARKYGIPCVLQAYGSLARVMSKQGIKLLYDKIWGYKLIADASKLLAMTPTEIEQYGELGAERERIVTVPNCIEISEYERLPEKGTFREKYGITEDHIVLFLGRIDKIKGLDILVRAVAELDKEGTSIRLVIIGPDGGYLSVLKGLVKELKVEEKVIITGFVPFETKLAAYVDADVYVLPSVYETFPTTVLEASACGTPVIVTDRCQIAPLVDNIFGLAVPYDKDRLRDALSQVMASEEMRTRFGETGRALVREKYTWSRIAEQIEEVYVEVVTGDYE
ncbi:glycosyltransferase [Chloroflexota bacterium]